MSTDKENTERRQTIASTQQMEVKRVVEKQINFFIYLSPFSGVSRSFVQYQNLSVTLLANNFVEHYCRTRGGSVSI
jgi:hypothetical protein